MTKETRETRIRKALKLLWEELRIAKQQLDVPAVQQDAELKSRKMDRIEQLEWMIDWYMEEV